MTRYADLPNAGRAECTIDATGSQVRWLGPAGEGQAAVLDSPEPLHLGRKTDLSNMR
jgi:hypothetical protein